MAEPDTPEPKANDVGVTQDQRDRLYMFIRDIQQVCARHNATLYATETRPGRILAKLYDQVEKGSDDWERLNPEIGKTVVAAGVVERITPRRMRYMDVEVGEI